MELCRRCHGVKVANRAGPEEWPVVTPVEPLAYLWSPEKAHSPFVVAKVFANPMTWKGVDQVYHQILIPVWAHWVRPLPSQHPMLSKMVLSFMRVYTSGFRVCAKEVGVMYHAIGVTQLVEAPTFCCFTSREEASLLSVFEPYSVVLPWFGP